MGDNVPAPCDGLRVVDFTRGMFGNLAAMILADYGAEVVKIEQPGGDSFRDAPAWGFWNRGKGSIEADLKDEAAAERVRALISGADVLIENFRPGVMDRLGLGVEVLRGRNPRLVYCSMTGFGARGPWQRRKGYEGVVNAKTGRMREFSGIADREGPGFTAVPSAGFGALHGALQGILAALHVRRRTGRGSHVETSLLQGNTAYDMIRWYALQAASNDPLAADRLRSWGAVQHQIPRPNYLTAVTRDGVWLQFANTMPHLFMAQMVALGLTDLYSDPRYVDLPALSDPDDSEGVWEAVLERVREKTWAEWKAILDEERDVAVEPFHTVEQAFDHPQVRHNGHVVRVGGQEQAGPLVRMAELPAVAPRPAPALGVSSELLDRPWEPREPGPEGAAPTAPLDGVTVVDFATYYATPFGSSLLADLGARVIKVEPPEGDYSRYVAGRMLHFKTTGGKESLAIDLKTGEGREVVHRMLAHADIVLHNFRPGVADRLGIGYEHTKQLNPRVVYHYGASYGDSGPYSFKPAFHPIAGAIGGGAIAQMPPSELDPADAELPIEELKQKAWRLLQANEGNPDVNAALSVGTALLLGLHGREEHGRGQYQTTSMLCANIYANGDAALRYEGKPARVEPDALLLGVGPLSRLYQTADDGWVFVAAPFEHEWRALATAIGREELLGDPRFVSRAARAEHADALAEALAETFATRDADGWERLLAEHDVACARADGPTVAEFAVEEPSNYELGFTVPVEHPIYGRYARHGAIVTLDSAPARIGPACEVGEHSERILAELGYSSEEIEALAGAGVVALFEQADEETRAAAAISRSQQRGAVGAR